VTEVGVFRALFGVPDFEAILEPGHVRVRLGRLFSGTEWRMTCAGLRKAAG
jgi:hypothetical protein